MRSGARLALCVTSVFVAALNFSACGSTNEDSQVTGSAAGAAMSNGSGATSNGGGATNSGGGALNLITGGSSFGLGVAGVDDSCAADVSTGKLVPLDIYIMLDVSSSMLELTATNVSKWDAVKSALETFLKDDASAGIGVGLQYFPIQKPNAPTSCASDRDCTGGTGPCFLKWCYQAAVQLGQVVPCGSNADCGAYLPCTTVAQCSDNTDYICTNIGAACDPRDPSLGTCTAIPPSFCEHTASCDVAAYNAPAAPIATLPGAAAALSASIDAKMPNGTTPTGPALSGAIQQAAAWGKAHPDHRVVVLLATDGLPTECTPTDIDQVSAIAARGVAATPSIDTFVIGVFGPADVALDAPANLDTIAVAGNTTSAYIVDTSQDLSLIHI